jgi:hypothetical protein
MDASWSPDGRVIAFWSELDGDPEIHLVDTAGLAVRPLTDDPGSDVDPAWQPDPRLSVFGAITQVANDWAPLFAAGDQESCQYQTQPLCERIACARVGGATIENCTPPTRAFRRLFESAVVEDVAIGRTPGDFGGKQAAVRFSNGEVVLLWQAVGAAGPWMVHDLGSAGREFFRDA